MYISTWGVAEEQVSTINVYCSLYFYPCRHSFPKSFSPHMQEDSYSSLQSVCARVHPPFWQDCLHWSCESHDLIRSFSCVRCCLWSPIPCMCWSTCVCVGGGGGWVVNEIVSIEAVNDYWNLKNDASQVLFIILFYRVCVCVCVRVVCCVLCGCCVGVLCVWVLCGCGWVWVLCVHVRVFVYIYAYIRTYMCVFFLLTPCLPSLSIICPGGTHKRMLQALLLLCYRIPVGWPKGIWTPGKWVSEWVHDRYPPVVICIYLCAWFQHGHWSMWFHWPVVQWL